MKKHIILKIPTQGDKYLLIGMIEITTEFTLGSFKIVVDPILCLTLVYMMCSNMLGECISCRIGMSLQLIWCKDTL